MPPIPDFRLPSKGRSGGEIVTTSLRLPKDLADLLDEVVRRNPGYSRHEAILWILRVGATWSLAQSGALTLSEPPPAYAPAPPVAPDPEPSAGPTMPAEAPKRRRGRPPRRE